MGRYIVILLFILAISCTDAKQIYVSPDGDVANCGSPTSPCDGLSLGVQNAESGDSIIMLKGDYYGSSNWGIPLNKSIHITSESGAGNTVISLDGAGPVFTIGNSATVTLTGITFQDCSSDLGACLTITDNSVVNVNNCVFTNNTASDGGAIYVTTGASVSISHSDFSENFASNAGGAIATENGGSITLQFVNMYRNRSPRGSAIYTASGNVTGSFVDFYLNFASNEGTVHVDARSLAYLTSAKFTNNTASSAGGALYSRSSFAQCVDCIATGNFAFNGGAFMSDYNGGIVLVNTTVTGNSALNGAALYGAGSHLTTYDTILSHNSAYNHGGAVYLTSEAKATLTNTSIFSNVANGNAGAVNLATRSQLHLNLVTIYDNVAKQDGGAFFCSDSKIWTNETKLYDNKDQKGDSTFFCSSFPSATFCAVYGMPDVSEKCGFVPQDDTIGPHDLPTFAIIGIGLGGTAVIICIVVGIVCLFWRKAKKEGGIAWKAIEEDKDDNNELLEDYD